MKKSKSLRQIIKSPIFKLTSGSIIAQLVAIVASPITTRLYTAQQLGTYTLLLTVVTMFGPLLSGKIEMAIVSEKKEKKIYPIIVLSGILCIFFSTIVTLLYSIYLLTTIKVSLEYFAYVIIIYIYMLITGFTNILVSYNNRNKDYEIISSVYVIRTTIQNIGLVLFGICNFSVIGMLLSQVIGSLFGIKRQSKKLILKFENLKLVTKAEIKQAFMENYKLLIYTTPSTLCNSASYSLINFFISSLYGTIVFGYYSLSYRILGIPLAIISSNVSKVFFERASKSMNETGGFKGELVQMTLLLSFVAVPMIIVLLILAPSLCAFVFGTEWVVAGEYIRILVFMFGIRLVVSALTPSLVIANKQSIEFKIQILFLACSTCTFLISKLLNLSIQQFLFIIMITYSIVYLIMYIIILRLSKGDVKYEN